MAGPAGTKSATQRARPEMVLARAPSLILELHEGHGWTPAEPVQAVADADVIAIMVPDHVQAELWESIADHVKPGATLLFTHGFSIHFGTVKPPEGINVIMCAPKGPGHLVRRLYTEGAGVPALIVITFNGILGPAGMPDAVVTKLNADIVAVANSPDMKERMRAQAAVTANTPIVHVGCQPSSV